jgi:uncharacterized protein (TIGR02391 family)
VEVDVVATAEVVTKFNDDVIEGICRTLADMVTHREISEILQSLKISEAGGIPKWERLLFALRLRQLKDGHSNNTIQLTTRIVNPVRFVGSTEKHMHLLLCVNKYLSFVGVQIGEDGIPKRVNPVSTLREAEERADSLKAELRRRNVHSDILKYCTAELLDKNYFHCVLEASKSLAQKIRDRVNTQKDGAALCDEVFSISNPLLALSSLQTESEQNEQKGFSNFLKGIFGMFRNVTAHSPKIKWVINEKGAIEALTIISFAHSRVDEAVLVPKYTP